MHVRLRVGLIVSLHSVDLHVGLLARLHGRLYVGLHAGLHVGLYVSLDVGLHIGLHIGLHVHLYSDLHVCLHVQLHIGLHVRLHASLHIGLHIGLHVGRLHVCMYIDLLVSRLLVCLHISLHACQPACPSACQCACHLNAVMQYVTNSPSTVTYHYGASISAPSGLSSFTACRPLSCLSIRRTSTRQPARPHALSPICPAVRSFSLAHIPSTLAIRAKPPANPSPMPASSPIRRSHLHTCLFACLRPAPPACTPVRPPTHPR